MNRVTICCLALFFTPLGAQAEEGHLLHFPGFLRAMAPIAGEPISEGRPVFDWRKTVYAVNQKVNEHPYVEERKHEDIWQTPMEFYKSGGDCEDYAIAKYYALKEAGIPEKALNIVVTYSYESQSIHALLMVAQRGEIMILDNLTKEPQPLTYLKGHKVMYLINRLGWKRPPTDPSQWRDYAKQ